MIVTCLFRVRPGRAGPRDRSGVPEVRNRAAPAPGPRTTATSSALLPGQPLRDDVVAETGDWQQLRDDVAAGLCRVLPVRAARALEAAGMLPVLHGGAGGLRPGPGQDKLASRPPRSTYAK